MRKILNLPSSGSTEQINVQFNSDYVVHVLKITSTENNDLHHLHEPLNSSKRLLGDNNQWMIHISKLLEMENFKSIRDCLEEGLKAANKTTFLYRVIYIGQHDFRNIADLKEYFQRNIDNCNNGHCYEKLTGFLLCYPNLLIHLIEGSEDVIHSHLESLCRKQQIYELHDLRIVIIWPHLITRATNNWFARSGQPRKSEIEVYSTCQASPFVRLCINSMCNLAELLSGEETSKMGCENGSKNVDSIPEELTPKLPDPDQIEFLTKCAVLVSVQDAYESMYRISRISYEDVVWPAPSVYIPYDVIQNQELNKEEI